jgi:molybdopterin-guanine dinucleotide biosynthesis protein A
LAEGISDLDVQTVPDAFPQGGSLVAIYSGLLAARGDLALVVGCDMPFLSTPLLERIVHLSRGFDVAVPRVGPHLEALHAAYRRSCLPVMEERIRAGRLKIIDFYPLVSVREVAESEMRDVDSELLSFVNVNTPADLKRARAIACRGG